MQEGIGKILILVSSQTGFTMRYADWISEETGADIMRLEEVSDDSVRPYRIIVFGCPIYGNEYHRMRKCREIQKRHPDKKFIFFATGIYPATEKTLGRIQRNNFGNEKDVALFYFPGGLKKEKLTGSQRALLGIYKVMMKRRDDLSEDDRTVLKRMGVSGDYTDRSYIDPLIQLLEKLEESG
jgi:menaquinone-dependent protoporphyrinogen IX oxidase